MEFEKKARWAETEAHQAETENQKICSAGWMEFQTKLKWLELKTADNLRKAAGRNEKYQVVSERDRVLNELMGLQKELANSLSWELIEQYRKLKDRIAPVRSRRRVFYERMLLKTIKVFQQEGMKGVSLRVKRKLRIHRGYLSYKSILKTFKPVRFKMESKIPETYCSVKNRSK